MKKVKVLAVLFATMLLLAGCSWFKNTTPAAEESTEQDVSTEESVSINDTAIADAAYLAKAKKPAVKKKTVQKTAQVVNVVMKDFAFSPSALTVKTGTIVKWTNKDSVAHNVIPDSEGFTKSPMLKEGKSYSYTFSAKGAFSYYCEPHPFMKGTIKVE